MGSRYLSLVLVIFLITGLASPLLAYDAVVINSVDGRDVLSGAFYANVMGIPSFFLTANGGGLDTLMAKVGSNKSIMLIQSKDSPVSTFLQPELAAANVKATVFISSDGGATNLELARQSGANAFIVVDTAYSDGALSALPFAAQNRAYVIMADKNNLAQAKEIISGKKAYLYGQLDSEVRNAFSGQAQAIGDGSSKYSDNLKIVSLMLDSGKVSGVIASDGTQLEDSMMNGSMPILLVGRVIPQSTYGFIKSNVRDGKLKSIMIAGNDLSYTMYDARERVRLDLEKEGVANKTFYLRIKFAQSIPGENGGSVLGLDTFRLPAYKPALNITEVSYDADAKRAMATVTNLGDGAAWYNLELRISVDGKEYKVLGSEQVKKVERGDKDGQALYLDLTGVQEGNVTALATIKYGASPDSLDDFSTMNGPLASISYNDESKLVISGAQYDASKKSMVLSLRNTGAIDAYATTRITMVLSGSPATITGAPGMLVSRGGIVAQEIPLDINQSDLAANSNVRLVVDYGSRQGFLNKRVEQDVPLVAKAGAQDNTLLVLGGLGLILVVAIGAWAMGQNSARKAR